MRAIIVEDSPECLELYEAFLLSVFQDIIVEKESNGLDGINKIMENKYNFIWTDLNMPYMGGIGLIENIRSYSSVNKDTFIFVASGDEDLLGKLRSKSFTNMIILEKPVTIQEFRKVVSEKLQLPPHIKVNLES